MTARKPAEVIQEVYGAFGRRDIPAIVAALADNVSWTVHGPQTVPYAGKCAGKAAVQGWFDTLRQTITVTQFDVEKLIANGDSVAAVGSFGCTVNATGKPYATRFVHLWRVPNGKIAAFEDFIDTAAAASAHSR
jgi:ketosteroid isomerase-like protein